MHSHYVHEDKSIITNDATILAGQCQQRNKT